MKAIIRNSLKVIFIEGSLLSSMLCACRKRVADIYNNISNMRKYFLHKTSFGLVDENQVIYLEDLNIKVMQKNRC